MASIVNNKNVKVEYTATLTLTEIELRALNALTVYGTDVFIKHFKETMGVSAISKNEAGLHTLFQTVRETVRPALSCIDSTRLIVEEQMKQNE